MITRFEVFGRKKFWLRGHVQRMVCMSFDMQTVYFENSEKEKGCEKLDFVLNNAVLYKEGVTLVT